MVRSRALAGAALFVALGLFGCRQGNKVTELEAQVKALAETVSKVHNEQADLARRVESLSEDESVALISCTEKGYAFLRTKLGQFLVSCDDMRVYGDGQKITLRIGNPHNITLNGPVLKVKWSPRPPLQDGKVPAQSEIDAWVKSGGQKEVKLTEAIRPGVWNRVDVVLAPARAEEVALIQIRISVDQVGLGRW